MHSTISANNMAISRLQKEISALEADINKLTGNEGDLGQANKDLATVVSERDTLGELKLRLMEEKSYSDAAGEMLKDTGIKTKVIKQYLPVMNKLVNQYLQVLDFFVSFNLDENFNEVIKSRHRDAFNYASFSEGEKQRIDLSLLFTWRQIAKMKNSTSTNLLILDETFDSSLDHDGIDNLMKILGTLEDDSNVFVISHKGDLLDGKFRSKIEFVKEHNFSKVA
jgi:DNA repair exonuclease SbcCD ATPase subunit